jgi:hypothetical protein
MSASSKKHFTIPAGAAASVKIIDTTSSIGKLEVSFVSHRPLCKSPLWDLSHGEEGAHGLARINGGAY